MFCPHCHQSTFSQHWLSEFREWHKCTHCGFMQESSVHFTNIKQKVDRMHSLHDDSKQIDKDKLSPV